MTKPRYGEAIQDDQMDDGFRPPVADRLNRPVKSIITATSASQSGGQRYMRVSLAAAPWEVGE